MLFAVLLALANGAAASESSVVIAIAPIGSVDRATVGRLVPVVSEAFHAKVVVAPPLPLPARSYDADRGQHRSTTILDELARARRPEWNRLLGVSDVDLYVPELNFVFGEADAARGVAVFSLWRLHPGETGPAAQQLYDRRAATEAIHELGHTYGLRHCDNPRCVMWFSNTLAESDRKGTAFCAKHAAELERALQK